jgi:hypothetical protein
MDGEERREKVAEGRADKRAGGAESGIFVLLGHDARRPIPVLAHDALD